MARAYGPDCALIGLFVAWLVCLFLLLPALRHVQLLNPNSLFGPAGFWAV